MPGSESEQNVPYIKGQISLPEVTVKAVLVGVILAAIFTMSSLYIGLKFQWANFFIEYMRLESF